MIDKERLLNPFNRRLFKFLLLVLTAAGCFASLFNSITQRSPGYALSAGSVSVVDILAPTTLTYTSQILTDQARQDAETRVAPVYLPADPSIARRQLEQLRVTLSYINSVRFDAYASQDQKLADIANLRDIQIAPEDVSILLGLNESRWEAVQREALSVLEQVLRGTIREGDVKETQRRVPTLVSFSLSQEQAQVVTSLVTPYVVANSLYSAEQTAAARESTRAAVEPVQKTYIAGEIIVRRGQIITPSNEEALQQYDLVTPQENLEEILAALALTILLCGFIAVYLSRRRLTINDNLRGLLLIAFNFLLFLVSSRLVIPDRTVIPYLFPLQAFGLTIAALFQVELALVLSLVLSIFAAYGMPNSLDLTIYYAMSSLVGILALSKATRISHFFWSGISIGISGALTILAYRLSSPLTDLIGIATLSGAALFAGIASASLSLLFQFLYSQILGMTTALQLLEISRPDHPLLQYILQYAPGSYQHSLQVAVIAEQAAEKIGADSLLIRVGGMYHDCGKAANPSFFIENQVGEKLNPHDDLDPIVSAQTILRHIEDGVALARKHRLPPRIQDFIREHHGTMLTRYQYTRAVQAAGNDYTKVDENLFRYPGPIPASRETALLMLADGTQARVRAELPETEDEIRAVVRKVIDYCQKEGQLDNTRMTLKDLSIITESFVQTLKNTYHPRIRYPEINPPTVPAAPPKGPQP
jgi:putative nucleotidyltransferase with HDIG domain